MMEPRGGFCVRDACWREVADRKWNQRDVYPCTVAVDCCACVCVCIQKTFPFPMTTTTMRMMNRAKSTETACNNCSRSAGEHSSKAHVISYIVLVIEGLCVCVC